MLINLKNIFKSETDNSHTFLQQIFRQIIMKINSKDQKYDYQREMKQQINNLNSPDEIDISSFAESKNQIGKYFKNSNQDNQIKYNPNHIFPEIQAPSIQFSADTNILIIQNPKMQDQFSKAQSQIYDQDKYEQDQKVSIQQQTIRVNLKQQNKKLKQANRILIERFNMIGKNKMNDTETMMKEDQKIKNNMKNEMKKLTNQLRQQDKKNIELNNENKNLIEQIKILKEDLDKKNKLFMLKNAQLKRQKQKTQSISLKIKNYQQNNQDYKHKLEQLQNQIITKDSLIKKLQYQKSILQQNILQINEQMKGFKVEFLRQEDLQKKLKITNKELMQRLKQETSRTESIKNSMVSNTSIMDSFSPQMLSPQQTIQIIYEVFKRVARSSSMLKILYQNKGFVQLIGMFHEQKLRRRGSSNIQ